MYVEIIDYGYGNSKASLCTSQWYYAHGAVYTQYPLHNIIMSPKEVVTLLWAQEVT